MNFILYDGIEWKNLFPITLTRPVSEIRLGLFTLKERWEKYIGNKASGIITQSFLSKKYSLIDDEYFFENILLINSSFLPNEELIQMVSSLKENEAVFFKEKIIAVKKNFFSCEKKENVLSFKKKHNIKNIIHIQYPWDIFMNNETVLKKDFMFFTKKKNLFLYWEKIMFFAKRKFFWRKISKQIILY